MLADRHWQPPPGRARRGRRARAENQHAVSQLNADRRPRSRGWRPAIVRRRGRAAWAGACAALLVVAGCSEAHKYWDRSPTAPQAPEVSPPPGVTIVFPPEGHRVAATGTLVLSATAMDGDVAIAPARVSWQSSRDGTIGPGPYLRVRNLSAGTHLLTVTAVSSSGAAGSSSVTVEVLAHPTYSFGTDIYGGILLPRCYTCHYPSAADWPNHHLDRRTYAGLVAGGDSHAYECVAPCRPESSLVWNKLTVDPPWVGAPMPGAPYPKVPASQLEKLRVWILEGAPPP